MNNIKIAILLGAPFTEQNIDRLGLRYLTQFAEVHVFDCSKLVGRNNENVKASFVHWPNYVILKSNESLRAELLLRNINWVIDNIDLDANTAWIGVLVRSLKIKLINVQTGLLPPPSFGDRVKNFFRQKPSIQSNTINIANLNNASKYESKFTSFFSLLKKVINRILYQWRKLALVPQPDLILLAGRVAAKSIKAKRAKVKIWIGSEDYYKFIETSNASIGMSGKKSLKPFIVFVDVCLPLASDWKFLGIAPPISAAEYYPKLSHLLCKIEVLTGKSVVVAGHPNSQYIANYDVLLGGRKIIFGKTANLVSNADLVLMHASTSASFVALAKKPALFISSRLISLTNYGARINAMAKALSSSIIMLEDADATLELTLQQHINEVAYKKYVENYLRSDECKEAQPWQALKECLCSL